MGPRQGPCSPTPLSATRSPALCTFIAPILTDLLQSLYQPRGQRGWEMEQEGLLLQLPQGWCEPAEWACGVGLQCQIPTSNPLDGQEGQGCTFPGALCPVELLSPAPQDSTALHSLVVTDADDWPHEEPPLCPLPPAPACWHDQAPRLCLFWAFAVNDAEEYVDGSLGE